MRYMPASGYTVARLHEAVRAHGGVLENDSVGRWTVYQCIAPEGYVWVEGHVKAIKVEWLRADLDYGLGAIADALQRISHGLIREEEQ